jgi:hypothetical protein
MLKRKLVESNSLTVPDSIMMSTQLQDSNTDHTSETTISLSEAATLATTEGFNHSLARSYLLLALVNGEIEGAYQDKYNWRMPYESFRLWLQSAIDAVEQQQTEIVAPKMEFPWGCLCWLGVVAIVWFFGWLLQQE